METQFSEYCLKTTRRKKRLQKWGRQKELRSLNIQLWDLHKKEKELGYVELEKPVEAGWVRYFVLRQDVARCKEALFYQRILDRINTKAFCNRKDFLKKSRKTKKLNPIEQYTMRLRPDEFERRLFTEKEKALFELKIIKEKGGGKHRAYVFLEEWRFDFKVKKHWITHKKVHDNVLEQRIAELGKVVNSEEMRGKLNKVFGYRRYRDYDEKNKVLQKDLDRSLKEMLLEVK
jgi:hypothetical protein